MSWLFGILLCALLGPAALKPLDDSSEHGVKPGVKSTNCTCGWANRQGKRIVGGTTTGEFEYPMMAGVVYRDTNILFCGATIITQRHVVTAAHCSTAFVDKPHQIGIHVGHHNYQKVKSKSKLKDVEKVIVHEKFDAKTVKYDIALFKLKEKLSIDLKIGPACLPTSRQQMVGKIVKVLGWGLTKNKGKQSDILLKADIEIRPWEYCTYTNIYMEVFDKHQICTFTSNKDSCSGDSGGPLLWLDPETNRYTLVATTSYGSNCGHNPAVNSEVAYFMPWIQKVIADTDPSMKTCAKV
uniref:Venom S1 protease 22 n=1 Tax=Ectomocoris sp. TaxID=3104572 RepID=A0AB38ZE83_9HEMI